MRRSCDLPRNHPLDPEAEGIVRIARTLAIVGMSPKPHRPSYRVGMYLHQHGYEVIPVNPGHERIDGLRCYTSLTDIPKDTGIDVVIIFRRPEDVPPIVDQAIARGAQAIWMQEGVSPRGGTEGH